MYTNECNAKDCRVAMTGDGKQRKLAITAVDKQGRGAIGVVFDVQLQTPSGAMQVLKVTDDQQGQYAISFELPEEGQSKLVVMLRGVPVPGSPFALVFHAGLRWNITPAYLVADHQVTDNGRLVTKTGREQTHKTSISATPVTSEAVFTYFNGNAILGLGQLAAFRLNKEMYSQAGAYQFACTDGRLYGSGISSGAYTQAIAIGSTVRCVRDVAAKTISFVINGVNKGIAYTGVPAADLYAVVDLYCTGASVRLD